MLFDGDWVTVKDKGDLTSIWNSKRGLWVKTVRECEWRRFTGSFMRETDER